MQRGTAISVLDALLHDASPDREPSARAASNSAISKNIDPCTHLTPGSPAERFCFNALRELLLVKRQCNRLYSKIDKELLVCMIDQEFLVCIIDKELLVCIKDKELLDCIKDMQLLICTLGEGFVTYNAVTYNATSAGVSRHLPDETSNASCSSKCKMLPTVFVLYLWLLAGSI